ncbi:hypothetical protein [Tenacibaculum haliotis]|uniref:hypothetical protein n=1 Tax=Tenacibaculum haliotis TaxID=1888914 RepID=UPI0021AEEDB6|nr:hypothetical protein [Tenacibaculum haliotis]MCT4698089.1 hypothetical protein [Tenacibaculum haliotis]
MQITVLNRQSFLDVAVLITGSVENAFKIANANNKAPSETINAGDKITIPPGVILNKDIVNHYKEEEILPATGLTQEHKDTITGCEGIGCWAIGIDFKVS